MTLARDERIFLIILLVNLIVSVVYLLIGIVIVTIRSAAEDKKDKVEILRDNRRTYFLRFLIMILCPVLGPLFFFMGHLCYILFFHREVDLANVVFAKDRVRSHLMADEARDRNIIPLEEAILVSEKKDLRTVVMSVIKEDFSSSLSSITLALNSEDSETAHYAATVLSDELNKFRIHVQKLWNQIHEEEDGQTECEAALLDYMDSVLRQHVFSEPEQRKFVKLLEETAQLLYDKQPDSFTLHWYEEVCLRTLEIKEFEVCAKWCGRLAERFPDELSAYTCKLKLYFASQDNEAFFETMGALKKSNVVIDSETLELVRIFS